MRYQDLYDAITRGGGRDRLPEWGRGILEAVDSGQSPITAVRHPLGFLCIPVERSGAHGVCLHIWPAAPSAARTTTSQIHCHSWDLVSYVLHGSIHNEVVTVTDGTARPDGPGGAVHRLFHVLSRGETDEIIPTARTVRQAGRSLDVHRRGESYSLAAGVFHQSSVPHPPAATIALGVLRPGTRDLSLGPPATGRHRITRLRCEPGEAARAVRDLIEHMSR